jgi:GT2 family glycosyltransferase
VILSVLIPTTGRRPELLERCLEAYTDRHGVPPGIAPVVPEVAVIDGYTWGEGLNQLAKRASGDYWLCICDDTLPWPGWFEAAKAKVDAGFTPASRYFQPTGEPLHPSDMIPDGEIVPWCRSFLLTPEIYDEVGPFIDTTWYADTDYSERLRASGREIVGCDGFCFTHLNGERDWLTAEEQARELLEYQKSHERQGIS